MSSPAHELALLVAYDGPTLSADFVDQSYEVFNADVGAALGTFGTDIFTGAEPPEPDNVTTLYDTGGAAPVLFDDNLRMPRIQVRVRDHDYTAAYSQQQNIFTKFNALIQDEFEQHYYVGVWLVSDIISLGRDESGRFVLTANYEIQRELI